MNAMDEPDINEIERLKDLHAEILSEQEFG